MQFLATRKTLHINNLHVCVDKGFWYMGMLILSIYMQ